MKRVLAAFLIIVALGAQAKAADNVRTSAQKLDTSIANNALSFDLMANETLMGVEITGLTAAGATLTIEGSTDGRPKNDPAKVWFSNVSIPFTCPSPTTFTTVTADGPFKSDVSGLTNIRVRVSSTGTGNALVSINAIPSSTLGSCGGTGGSGGGGGSVNIHDSSGNALNSTGGALDVSGTFTATLGGFTPSASGARMTPLTVQLTDSSQTLPTGAVVVVDNTDTTNPMYCNVNGIAATTGDKEIPPSSWFSFTIPNGVTTLHCIATGAPVIAHGTGGAGLATGAGGGGGSGGGGTFTWPGTAGNAIGGTSAGSNTMPYVNNYQVNPIPAGSNSIGTVGLNGGSNSIGTVGLNTGSNVFGSIANTAFGISGSLPGFASTPTFNFGTLGGAATAANQEVTTAGTTATSGQGVQGVTGGIHFGANMYDSSGNSLTSTAGALNVAGSFAASIGSFQPNGGYLNAASVSSTAVNVALPTGATGNNVVLYNYGGYKIIYQLNASSTLVSQATADGVLQPGAAIEVSVGANTNISYATTSSGLVSALQLVSGTGLWTGTGNNNLAVGQTGMIGGIFASQIAGLDNSSLLQVPGITAAGTNSTHDALAVQGITGGVPLPISGSVTATFSQYAPNGNYSAPLTVGGSSTRVVLPGGGGPTIAVYNVGGNAAYVLLGNSSVVATSSNDWIPAGGFLCFAVGGNVDLAAIETTGPTTINIGGGSGGCAGSSANAASVGAIGAVAPVSATLGGIIDSFGNLRGLSSANPMPVDASGHTLTVSNPSIGAAGGAGPASLAAMGANGNGGTFSPLIEATVTPVWTANSATTQQLVAAVTGARVYVTSAHCQVQGTATGPGDCQLVQGTGSNCATSQTALSEQLIYTASNGYTYGSGIGPIYVSATGNAVCVKTTLETSGIVSVGSIGATQF